MGNSDSSENMGWRILEILPNSPCSDKNLCVYFDFIVGINGVRLDTTAESFWTMISQNENQPVILTIFNFKTRIKRDVEIIPNRNWGEQNSLLGLVIVLSDFTKADSQCIHITKVHPNSPAQESGLIAKDDYLLGTPVEPFTNFDKFSTIIHEFIDQVLPIWVYNSKYASIRLVEIIPSSNYNGEGILGCEVADGFLNNIPSLNENQNEIFMIPSNDEDDDNEKEKEATQENKENENINLKDDMNHQNHHDYGNSNNIDHSPSNEENNNRKSDIRIIRGPKDNQTPTQNNNNNNNILPSKENELEDNVPIREMLNHHEQKI